MTTDLKLIKKRKKKNIIREIYLGDYVVVKRFIKTSIFPDMRRIWRYEDQSLRRLSGLTVPKTYGYRKRKIKEGKEIIYVREFLEGKPIERFYLEDMEPLAKLMVQIHKRGVITRDPIIENFIRTSDRNVLFIDFGRSLLVNPKNPMRLAYIGKELSRLMCHSFFEDGKLHNRFQEMYFTYMQPNRLQRLIIERVYSFWRRRFRLKYKHSAD
jgi:serine/threonine protein kinase